MSKIFNRKPEKVIQIKNRLTGELLFVRDFTSTPLIFEKPMKKKLLVIAGFILINIFAKGQSPVECNWLPKMDTIKFKYLVHIEADNLKVEKNSYVIQFMEYFSCPISKQPIAERDKKIFYNGKEINPVFVQQ